MFWNTYEEAERKVNTISPAAATITQNQNKSFVLKTGGAKGNGLAPKTVNSILSLLRNILEYAAREKDLPIADTKDISVKQPQKPLRILSRSEQQRLSDYLQGNAHIMV